MVKKNMKASDGKYHIAGKVYEVLEGSRAQVGHHTAYKTPGGLVLSDLVKNKHGRYVSKKKHFTAKRENRLKKAGYGTVKGKFGAVKLNGTKMRGSKKNRTKKHSRRRHRK
jgi:hypothetical protein